MSMPTKEIRVGTYFSLVLLALRTMMMMMMMIVSKMFSSTFVNETVVRK